MRMKDENYDSMVEAKNSLIMEVQIRKKIILRKGFREETSLGKQNDFDSQIKRKSLKK